MREAVKDGPGRPVGQKTLRPASQGTDAGVGEGAPSPRPTPTSTEAHGTEDKVYLVQAAEDLPEGEDHGDEEDETQDKGQHHEAHAHVDENWGEGGG